MRKQSSEPSERTDGRPSTTLATRVGCLLAVPCVGAFTECPARSVIDVTLPDDVETASLLRSSVYAEPRMTAGEGWCGKRAMLPAITLHPRTVSAPRTC